MSKIDETYLQGLSSILEEGYLYEDTNRKGVYRREIPSFTLRHNLSEGFPIISLKKSFFKGAVAELLFFLSGSTDIRDLWKRGVYFWDKDWARFHNYSEERVIFLKNRYKKDTKEGDDRMYDMGRIYPAQYRDFTGVDQLTKVLKTLKDNPMSTSMIVNAWNPAELDNMCLPPCHYGFQIVGRPLRLQERMGLHFDKYKEVAIEIDESIPKYGFEIHWQQRSTDYFLGTPINVQYYATMAHLFEILTGHKALAIQGDLKNVHLYDNQFQQAQELRKRNAHKYENTKLSTSDFLNRVKDEYYFDKLTFDEILNDIKVEDFTLEGYKSYPKLTAEMLSYDE